MKFKELLIACGIGFFVLFTSNLPLLSGLVFPKQNLHFLGRQVINSQDTYTYVSFIEQARQGRVIFENLYRSENQKQNLLRPSYALIGFFSKLFSFPSIFAYHLSRLILCIFFMTILYWFLSLFFKKAFHRLCTFYLILTSMGLGYLSGFFFDSTDLWIPESITFLSISEAPHFILSQIYMLFIFGGLILGLIRKKKRYYMIAIISVVLLALEHPFNLVVIASSVGLFCIWGYREKLIVRKDLLTLGGVIFFCLLGLLYQYVETISNVTLSSWAGQSNLSSPVPLYYILGYGFILPFAFIGFEKYLVTAKIEHRFILCWVVVTLVLLYMPVFFQRRFSEGLHIPISILAAVGIFSISLYISHFFVEKLKQVSFVGSVVFLLAVLSIGAINSVVTTTLTIHRDNSNAYYYYVTEAEYEGMEWIRQNTSPDDIVLTNWFYGNILPGVAGRKVYIGHKIQTPNFDQKINLINSFLLEKDAKKALEFLHKNKIKYIYLGNNDTMLQYGFEPSKKAYLIKEFDEGGVTVRRVR